jgi:Transposase and inactivated derivatives
MALPQDDIDYIVNKYPAVAEIKRCIEEFRSIYTHKSSLELEAFVIRYSGSTMKPIRSFASGLRNDWNAVRNSVLSELSNGFVEGINNKIKAIKRTMYGRAKIDLLRVKVLYAR